MTFLILPFPINIEVVFQISLVYIYIYIHIYLECHFLIEYQYIWKIASLIQIRKKKRKHPEGGHLLII